MLIPAVRLIKKYFKSKSVECSKGEIPLSDNSYLKAVTVMVRMTIQIFDLAESMHGVENSAMLHNVGQTPKLNYE